MVDVGTKNNPHSYDFDRHFLYFGTGVEALRVVNFSRIRIFKENPLVPAWEVMWNANICVCATFTSTNSIIGNIYIQYTKNINDMAYLINYNTAD